MSVRITVTRMVGPCVSPGGVSISPGCEFVSPGGVCVSPGGGGSDQPPVGMLPAKLTLEIAHISASAIVNRFMDFAPFEVEKCRSFYIKKNGTTTQDFLQGGLERTTIRFAFAQLLANRKSQILMRTASSKLDTSHLTANEEADLKSRLHQKSEVTIFNAQSMSTAPQMNNSNLQRMSSIALTSRTTSATCYANSIDSEKRISTLSKPAVCLCVSETR